MGAEREFTNMEQAYIHEWKNQLASHGFTPREVKAVARVFKQHQIPMTSIHIVRVEQESPTHYHVHMDFEKAQVMHKYTPYHLIVKDGEVIA